MAHAADFRIQVAPATALAELAARAELAGGSLAQAAALVPSGLLAQARAAETEGQTADCTIRAASAAHLAEAVARLETWLISTRGAELRKTKSSAAALRVVAHVAYAHARCSEEAMEMSEGAHIYYDDPKLPSGEFQRCYTYATIEGYRRVASPAS